MSKKIVFLGAITALGAISWAMSPFWAAEDSSADMLSEAETKHAARALGKEAASELVARALRIDLEQASRLVSRAVKGARLGSDAPKFAVAGVLSVKAYSACASEQSNPDACLNVGYQVVSFGKAFGPQWAPWDDLKNMLDVSKFCSPIEIDVIRAQVDGAEADSYSKLALQAWNEAGCDARIDKEGDFGNRILSRLP